MDEMVLAAQKFVNDYNVSGIPKLEETGRTGWPLVRALTRVLQHHLGITNLSDSFGPATLAALQDQYPIFDGSGSQAITRVIQSALYAKGYDGEQISGNYGSRTVTSIVRLKQNMGVEASFPGLGVPPKVFKALLTMDAYTLVADGSVEVQNVQKWMNSSFINRRDFYISPCDGIFSRDVQKNLMFAIQYTAGMADGVANGNFGPGTQSAIRGHELSVGSTGPWVQLFTAAMLFNKRSGVQFGSTYTASLADKVKDFQRFVMQYASGIADFPTWASLLVSYGDKARPAIAFDSATSLTAARIDALWDAGYRIAGRYLCNAPIYKVDKMIQPGELARCQAKGMRVFPIYQTSGNEADYFTLKQGQVAALQAIEWSRRHGFRNGVRIYFAVDFDATDVEITEHVLPYFSGVYATMIEHAPGYKIGVYGSPKCLRKSHRKKGT